MQVSNSITSSSFIYETELGTFQNEVDKKIKEGYKPVGYSSHSFTENNPMYGPTPVEVFTCLMIKEEKVNGKC